MIRTVYRKTWIFYINIITINKKWVFSTANTADYHWQIGNQDSGYSCQKEQDVALNRPNDKCQVIVHKSRRGIPIGGSIAREHVCVCVRISSRAATLIWCGYIFIFGDTAAHYNSPSTVFYRKLQSFNSSLVVLLFQSTNQ